MKVQALSTVEFYALEQCDSIMIYCAHVQLSMKLIKWLKIRLLARDIKKPLKIRLFCTFFTEWSKNP
jgi:hypothetical protein